MKNATSAAEMEIMARITRVIVHEWDADVVLRAIVREATGLIETTAVVLWVTGVPPHELTLAYSHGLEPSDRAELATLGLDAFGSLGAASPADLLVVTPNDTTAHAAPLASYLHVQHLAAMLLVPLLARSRFLGIVGLVGRDAQVFDADESRRVARFLGDVFALAVESTGLQERLRETNAQLVTASIEAQQRAEELSEEKAEREAFISLIAHELKNPLAVLKLQIALMQRRARGAQQQAASLRTMAGSANQLQRLIDDLLDASRIASGHFSVEPEPVDIVSATRDVAQEQQATTRRHRLHVISEHDELTCTLDRQRLAQALSNLVSNAIKYSPDGGDIFVRVASDDGWARVSVEDKGAGLSAEDLARLFEPYTRILRVREARGTGLGLFITKGIVEAHGGTISVTSPGVGHGTTFTIAIRCDAAQEPQP